MIRQITIVLALALSAAIVGCKKPAPTADGPISLQLNWKPEPQFGGFYAATLDGGAFKTRGLNVTVTPGGSGVPTVQMLGTGKVDFAIVSGDEIAVARSQGNDVVALLAIYQDCPQGLMTRASRGFSNIGDIFTSPGTVALQKGLPYAKLLQKKYGFDKVTVVPSPNGALAQFQADPNFTQQCFVTSEPLAAKKVGIDTKTFLVKETGYNPYTTVLACRGELVRTNPKLVYQVATACREGWEAYLKDPTATNAAMAKLNSAMDAETLTASAEAQKPLILTDDAKAAGLGSMTEARWQTLVQQLVEAGDIKANPPAAKDCFVDVKTLSEK